MERFEGDTATAEEILRYLTRVMRGEEGGGGTASMKAAELLGKRLGLFGESGEELAAPVIIEDVAALRGDGNAGEEGG